MIVLSAEVRNEQGQIEEKKFELSNPDLEQWIEDAGEGLNGIEVVDK
jgi:hypothetical protein